MPAALIENTLEDTKAGITRTSHSSAKPSETLDILCSGASESKPNNREIETNEGITVLR
jgi:hypothetical protein